MVPFDRFTVVLDACTIFPMLPRDVLLTLATHGFFSPKWSPRIRAEWCRNLAARMRERSIDADAQKRVDRIAAAMDAAFPDAEVVTELAEPAILEPVNAKDRHVVVTAIATRADAIITFNITDFAAGIRTQCWAQSARPRTRVHIVDPRAGGTQLRRLPRPAPFQPDFPPVSV